jgi:hypothetical protein
MSYYTHHTFLLGFPTGWSFTTHQEAEDSWASKETSGSLAFFKRLRFRGAGTFFAEALVTLGAITWAGGLLSTVGGIEGVVVAAFGGSSSSLHEAKKFCVTRQKQDKRGAIEELE